MQIISSDFNGFVMLLVLIVLVARATCDPDIVSRSEWNARPAKTPCQEIAKPVPYAVIHHSYVPPACHSGEECREAMRWMQDYHQFNRSWWDIGYNFAVGGDGKVYEGRGWAVVGAHAPLYNNISMGICLIGDWSVFLPPEQQLIAAQQLISMGVREGYIAEDYSLVGHKQVREGTTCPGDGLYEEIKKWPHYDSAPNYTNPKRSGEVATTPRAVPPEEDNKIRKRMAGTFLTKLV